MHISLSPEKLRTVVGYLERINLGKTDLDSKGRAFETFMGSFFRGDFGQYFTPRVIVKFIVDVLPITHESLVLDTSCGSGGFLLHALDKVRREADEYYPDHKTDPDEVSELIFGAIDAAFGAQTEVRSQVWPLRHPKLIIPV